MGRAALFAVAVALSGAIVVMCAIVPGLIAFALTLAVAQGKPAESLVTELLYEGGLMRVGVLVLVTGLVLSVLSAGSGAILWLLFGRGAPHVSLGRWVLRNAALWTLGFVASLVAALAVAVTFPSVNGDLILGIGGFATGLAAGKWVRDLAEGLEPALDVAEELEPVDLRATEGVPNPAEWYPSSRTGI
jgi:hypothetical protein